MSLKKLLTAIVTVSMVFSLVVPAVSADAASDLLAAAIGRMKGFGIVQGDQNGDLKLGDTITRAEIMKVLVTAAGKGDDAQLLRGAPAFSDTQAHWASGYVALAKAMGYTIGYPDGTFRPDNKITYGEIITLVVRAVGLDVSAQAYTWPNNYIHAAMDAGIIPPGIDATKVAGDFAIRSYVFLLADQAFLTVKLPSGKTTYQTHFVTVPPTLTVDQGASLSTSKDMVTISGSTNGISVTVGGAAAELTNGTFSTDVSVTLGSSTIAVVASDAVGNTTTANVAVTRAPAAAASISVDLPASVAAGSETAVTASVKDSYGNEIADAVVTGSCDAAVGTYDEATGKLTAAEAVGSGNCSFTSGAATTGDQAVSVVAGELAAITINGAATMASSAKQTLTVSGADQYGNAVTPSGAVAWSTTAGVIDQSGNFAPGGVSGTATVTATVDGISGTKTISVYGAAAGVQLTLSTNNIVANAASTTTVTATVVDAGGNAVSNFNGTVSFSITNGSIAYFGSTSGTTSGTATAASGAASIALTAGSTVGSAIVTASIPGSGISSTTGQNVTLTTVAQTLTSLKLSAGTTTLGADGVSTTSITVTPLDQAGVQMASLSSTIAATLSSSNTTIANFGGNQTATASFSSGTGSATLNATANNGTTTISLTSVTVGGSASSITASPITVSTITISPPQQLAISAITAAPATNVNPSSSTGTGVQTITVKVLDYAGNQVTNPTQNGQVTANLSPDSGTTKYSINGTAWTAVTANGNIPLTFAGGSQKIYVINSVAESVTWTLAGTWNPGVSQSLASATATSSFTPGAAASLDLSATPSTISANGTMTGTLTVKILDAAGNTVTDGAYSVTISRTTSNGATATFADQTVTTVNGKATVTFTASSTHNVTDTFTATTTINSATSTDTATVTSAIIGVSNKLDIDNTTSVTAGSEATITVQVEDSAGTTNYADNSTVVTLTLTGQTNAQVSTYTATAVNGVATFAVTQTAADTYDTSATASGLTADTAGPTQVVNAGAVAALLVKTGTNGAQPSTLAADGTSSITLAVYSADKYGNTIGGASPTLYGSAVTWTCAGGTSAVTACPTTGTSPTVVASGIPGVVTFTASTSTAGIASSSLTLTTVTTGPAVNVRLSVGDSTAADGSSQQSVKVSAIDSSGNVVTGSTAALNFSVSSGSATPTSTTHTLVASDLGSYTFKATSTKAETVTYAANLNSGTNVTASGVFTPGTADHITVGYASPAAAAGDGSSISSVTAKVLDINGNVVTGASGSIKFTVNSNYAYLQGNSNGDLTVPLSNGQATAILQARNVTNIGNVPVVIACVSCTDSDGTALTSLTQEATTGGGADVGATAALYVFPTGDTTAPSVSSAVYSASSGTITLTFSQPVKVTRSANSSWITTTGTLNGDFTIAQGSTAYQVVLTIPAGSNVDTSHELNAVATNAAIQGYNGEALTMTNVQIN